MRLALVIFVLIASSSGASDEDPPVFTPAHFYSAGEFAFQKIIRFPEISGDVPILLRCSGFVSRRGTFAEHSCFPLTEIEREYAKYVDTAANKARLKAATVNGKTKWIWFQYLVREK